MPIAEAKQQPSESILPVYRRNCETFSSVPNTGIPAPKSLLALPRSEFGLGLRVWRHEPPCRLRLRTQDSRLKTRDSPRGDCRDIVIANHLVERRQILPNYSIQPGELPIYCRNQLVVDLV